MGGARKTASKEERVQRHMAHSRLLLFPPIGSPGYHGNKVTLPNLEPLPEQEVPTFHHKSDNFGLEDAKKAVAKKTKVQPLRVVWGRFLCVYDQGANVRRITPYSAAWGALFRSRPCRAKTHHPPCEEYSHLHNVWANLQI